jgi:hypothetical protein
VGGLFIGLLMSHNLFRKFSVPWILCVLKQVGVQGSVPEPNSNSEGPLLSKG